MIDKDKLFKCPELKWSIEHLEKGADLANMDYCESFCMDEGCSKIKTCKAYNSQREEGKEEK